jgi:hypothetical protein
MSSMAGSKQKVRLDLSRACQSGVTPEKCHPLATVAVDMVDRLSLGQASALGITLASCGKRICKLGESSYPELRNLLKIALVHL